MVGIALRLLLAGAFAASALGKLAGGSDARQGLATFGVQDRRVQLLVWVGLIAIELVLAAGVAAGVDAFAWAGALLMLAFSGALVTAIARGRAGRPCACFGARSTVSWTAVVRNLALAAGLLAVPFVPSNDPTTEGWLAIGLTVALLACAGLTVAVLALAREIGMLRLRLGPASALEIPEEGPELGSRSPLVQRFRVDRDTRLALAVFTSRGCHVCQGLGPSIELLRREPALAVEVFDELDDSGVWEALDVPGSPYAVALGAEGTVLAKGTFNNLAQLESLLAAAERRAGARLELENLGV
jgi:Methylamine utilisation protein MauE